MQGFVGDIGIRHQAAGDLYDVRLTGCDDLFHLGRVIEGSDTGYRLADILLDVGCQIHIDASGEECVRMGTAEHRRIFMVAAGYLEQVYLVLDQLRDFHALVHIQTDIRQVISGDAALDGEPGADRLADSVQSHHQEPCAVLQASAELIGSLILHWGEELGEQPAVSRVDLDHVKSALLTELCGSAVGFHDLQDHLPGHLFHMALGKIFVTDAPCLCLSADGSADTLKSAPFSAVGELDIGIGARIVDLAGRDGKSFADSEGIQLQLLVVRLSGGRVNDCFTIGHDRGAALCLLFQIGDHLRCEMSLSSHHAGACRRSDDAVLQSDVADSDRFK